MTNLTSFNQNNNKKKRKEKNWEKKKEIFKESKNQNKII